jgi:hypothetical protein
MALNFLDQATENVAEFFPVFIERFESKVKESLITSLQTIRTADEARWKEVSEKWRKVVSSVEPHLAPVQPVGGRKKRTLRKKHRKHQK